MGAYSSRSVADPTRMNDVVDVLSWDFMVKVMERRSKQKDTWIHTCQVARAEYRAYTSFLEEHRLRKMPADLLNRGFDRPRSPSNVATASTEEVTRMRLTTLGIWESSCDLKEGGTSVGFFPWNAKEPVTFRDPIGRDGGRRLWTELSIRLFGKRTNYRNFFDLNVFDKVLSYLGGDIAFQLMPYCCVTWFVLYHQLLTRMYLFTTITSFIEHYGGLLELKDFAISPQSLFTANRFSRVDLLLYCEVLPECADQIVQIRHKMKYDRTQLTESPKVSGRDISRQRLDEFAGISFPKNSTFLKNEDFLAKYEFLAKKRASSRDLWILSDRSRHHGDEVCVSESSFPNACIGDILEIPVNFVNEFGMIDMKSFQFLPPVTIMEKEAMLPQEPSWSETAQDIWRDLASYKQLCIDRIEDWSSRFEPHLKGTGVHAIGIAQTCVRQRYTAIKSGNLKGAFEDFGQLIYLFPKDKPVLITLPRTGLRHDRFQDMTLRVGDTLTVFRLLGGGVDG